MSNTVQKITYWKKFVKSTLYYNKVHKLLKNVVKLTLYFKLVWHSVEIQENVSTIATYNLFLRKIHVVALCFFVKSISEKWSKDFFLILNTPELHRSRDVSGQKFLTRGSGRVICCPLGSGRVGSTYFNNHFGSGRAGSARKISGNFGSKITWFFKIS